MFSIGSDESPRLNGLEAILIRLLGRQMEGYLKGVKAFFLAAGKLLNRLFLQWFLKYRIQLELQI